MLATRACTRLQAIIGAENPIPSNGFAGAALYVSAASGLDVATLPSLKRLTDINGTTIIQDLALTNLTTGLSVRLSVTTLMPRGQKL